MGERVSKKGVIFFGGASGVPLRQMRGRYKIPSEPGGPSFNDLARRAPVIRGLVSHLTNVLTCSSPIIFIIILHKEKVGKHLCNLSFNLRILRYLLL